MQHVTGTRVKKFYLKLDVFSMCFVLSAGTSSTEGTVL